MKRQDRATAYGKAVPVVKTELGVYQISKQNTGNISAVFVPSVSIKWKNYKEIVTYNFNKGTLIDFTDEHNVRTYKAVKDGNVYKATDESITSGKKYKLQDGNGTSLHENVLIPYFLYGDVDEEKRMQACVWVGSSGMVVNINHKNGDLDTRDTDLLEVCTVEENNNHRVTMNEVVDMFDNLVKDTNVKNIRADILDNGNFLGFSARRIYNGDYFSIKTLREAYDKAIKTGDAIVFLDEALRLKLIKSK